MCFLVGSLPNGLVFRHELHESRSTIGRLGISTILLEEESVSALHAELIPVGDRRYLLRDLRSKNGTLVEGEKVSEAEIQAPCRLAFGHLSCELQSCDSETCMHHGKLSPPTMVVRPLSKPVPSRSGSHETSSRQRKTRPLTGRKRRYQRVYSRPIELGDAAAPTFRRDTASGSFAAPDRHAGRSWRLSARAAATVGSIAIFCAIALFYIGTRPTAVHHRPSAMAASLNGWTSRAAAQAARAMTGLEATLPAPVASSDGSVDGSGNSAPDLSPELLSPTPVEGGGLVRTVLNSEPLPPVHPVPANRIEPTPTPTPPPGNTLVASLPKTPAAPTFGPPAPEAVETSAAISDAVPAASAEPAPVATASSAVSETFPSADPEEFEEALVVQEARLLASVSHAEARPPETAPGSLEAFEPAPLRPAERPEAEAHAPLDFSAPFTPATRRQPWEFATAPDAALALNDLSKQLTPWSFDAGGQRTGSGELASLLTRPSGSKTTPSTPKPPEKVAPQPPVSVMILGDSLALCGFGSRLDKRFREATNVCATNTYMACGTVPMSWTKETSLKTYCGFWTIENPTSGAKKPLTFQDTYGMGKGKPKAYPVPKLEDLAARATPDVLIIQTGTNLFSLFRDGKTVQPDRHAPLLKAQIQPFLTKILKLPTPPRAIYWVASPTSGRVSTEIQDFVVNQVTALVGPMAKVIDSRPLVSYPYKHMEPDKEHFIGNDMDQWADRVYEIVQKDLGSHPLPLALAHPPGLPGDKPTAPAARPAAKVSVNDPSAVTLTAKLVGRSKPLRVDQLGPYGASLVSFLYEVQKVTQGEYTASQVVVMHPAHIGLKPLPLDKYRVGKSYELRVRELDGSAWQTIRSQDDFNDLKDLLPYIQLEDEARSPGRGS